MIGPFAIFVVADPKGDRPYVSTSMSAHFLESMIAKGCTVSKIDAEVNEKGQVIIASTLKVQLQAENWSPPK
jgi:hypothetical protein